MERVRADAAQLELRARPLAQRRRILHLLGHVVDAPARQLDVVVLLAAADRRHTLERRGRLHEHDVGAIHAFGTAAPHQSVVETVVRRGDIERRMRRGHARSTTVSID